MLTMHNTKKNKSKMATEKKCVLIAYAHNPEEYQELVAPEGLDPQMQELFERDRQRNEQQQKKNIREQKELVFNFANFLIKNHVEVKYDQQLKDTGCGNIMKWYEEQMNESDYVIIIVTPSLKAFLSTEEPPEEEMLFTGEFFDNFIRCNSDKILSVFLNRGKDREMLPMGLVSGNVYEIFKPFVLDGSSDEMDRLYAILTSQNRFEPPPSVSKPVPVRKRGRLNNGAAEVAGATVAPREGQLHFVFVRLSSIQTYLTDDQIFLISDNAKFSVRWKSLAKLLELTPAQIEMCEVDSGGFGEREKCLKMLTMWRNAGLYGPPEKISVAHLAHLVYNKLRNMEMFEVLGKCV